MNMTNILKFKNFVSEKLNIKPIQKSELEQGNLYKRIPTFYVYKGWLCAPNIFFEGEYAVSEQPIPNAPDVSLYGVYRTYDEFKKGIFYINMSFHIIIFSANLFKYAMEFHSANTPRGFFKKNNVFVIKDDKLLVIYRLADFNKLKKENESKHISEKLNIKPVSIDAYKKANEEKAAKFIEKFCLVYNETAKQYDCHSNMRLNNADLLRGKIPVRLGIVDGDFICNGCDSLVSLENAPIAVNGNFEYSGCDSLKSLKGAPLHVGGHFECRYCNMETLEYSPKTLGRDFDCSHCDNLKSLHGVTQTIRGAFRCSYCDNITNLKDSPSKIEGTLDCSVCINLQSLDGMADEVTSIDCSYCTSLKSLVGSPKNLYGNFDCRGCDSLKNLIGAPQIIGGNFRCGDSENLESLEGAPKRVETFSCAASVNLKTLEHSPLSVVKYYCTDCDSLKNLIGITQDVKETIVCYNCENLESLEGAPQDFKGYFSCGQCGNLKSLEFLPQGAKRKVLPDHLKSSKTQKTVTANEKLNIQPLSRNEAIGRSNRINNKIKKFIKRNFLTYNEATGLYDCEYDVKVYNFDIINEMFPIKFGYIKGNFDCSSTDLYSLKGAPYRIDGEMLCNNMPYLKNLEYAPKHVGGDFSISGCDNLESLEGAPSYIGCDFVCNFCHKLKNLKGVPNEIGWKFDCGLCSGLESLEGAPQEVGGSFMCNDNESLVSLEHSPLSVGGGFHCENCEKLKNLVGMSQTVGDEINCEDCDNLESLEGVPQDFAGKLYCSGCFNLKSLDFLPPKATCSLPKHLTTKKAL